VIEKYCRAIVPKATWNKVQKILAAHAERLHTKGGQNHPRRVGSTYLLSGMVRCARCDGAMSGLTSCQRSVSEYRRYRCNHAKQKKCTAKPIPAHLLEELVMHELEHFLGDETNLVELLGKFAKDQAGHQAAADALIASTRAELATVRKALANTSNAIAEVGGSATLLKKLVSLEAQENNLLAKIAQLETSRSARIHVPSRAEARRYGTAILANIRSQDTQTARQTLITLIHQIPTDRHGNHLVAQVQMYFDKATVSSYHAPVGAPIYRHSLKIEYLIQKPGNPLPIKKTVR
jgi:hypothetical protein